MKRMTKMTVRFSKIAFVAGLMTATALLGACSTSQAIDNTVDGVGYVGKTAVKATVGAGKLAYRGASAATRAATE